MHERLYIVEIWMYIVYFIKKIPIVSYNTTKFRNVQDFPSRNVNSEIFIGIEWGEKLRYHCTYDGGKHNLQDITNSYTWN